MTAVALHIRPLDLADLGAVERLERRAARQVLSRSSWSTSLRSK